MYVTIIGSIWLEPYIVNLTGLKLLEKSRENEKQITSAIEII